MMRLHVPTATGERVQLDADAAHHVTRVMRLDAGSDVVVFDGRGHEWDARLASTSGSAVIIDLLAVRVPLAEPEVAVTLVVGVLKGDQMDEVVRDATALGVTTIAPVLSDHVAVTTRGNWERACDRWRRVAVSAAMQCGRAVVPTVAPVAPFASWLSGGVGTLILCAEPSARVERRPVPDAPPARATLCVGPEGGWSSSERSAAIEHGAVCLDLGPRTLRAELAPAVALATIWERWRQRR